MAGLKRLFDKSEIWFAVVWIVIYVLAFSSSDAISESIGIPKLLTVLVGLLLSGILFGFIQKHRLGKYFGLRKGAVKPRQLLYYLPLILISSVNFWCGVTWKYPLWETALYILSMCFVGFLEEVIFRGLLFRGLEKDNRTTAIWVASVTFGVGHIVNLLNGAPLFDTLLQLVYACAVGFCYTAIFCVSGSILPCILSHIFVNSTSVFGVEPTGVGAVLIALIQTALGFGYGLWLLKKANTSCRSNAPQ